MAKIDSAAWNGIISAAEYVYAVDNIKAIYDDATIRQRTDLNSSGLLQSRPARNSSCHTPSISEHERQDFGRVESRLPDIDSERLTSAPNTSSEGQSATDALQSINRDLREQMRRKEADAVMRLKSPDVEKWRRELTRF